MAFIKSQGIVFGNGTELTTKYGIIPQNTTQIFYQASAPTGWTQVTHHDPLTLLESVDNKALRVVSTVGGAFGGIDSFTTVFPSTQTSINENATLTGDVGDTTLTVDQIPAHDHGSGESFPDFTSSAGSSPFRQEVRNPISYAFRSVYRQSVDQRNLVNFRQPTTVRQPNFYQQPRSYQFPANSQQPRNFRRPYFSSVRSPYYGFTSSQQPRTYRRPSSFRRPYWSSRPYSRRVRSGGWVCSNFQSPTRQRRWRWRSPSSSCGWRSFQQPRSYSRPANWQRPVGFQYIVDSRFPLSIPQPRRQPIAFNNQQPNSYRRPYSTPQPRSYRATINFRSVVNQRNPDSYRQPSTYRTEVRYPVLNTVRYASRVLAPGGEIRGTDQNGPDTSFVGGGLSHNHTFSGSQVPISANLDLRLQYIDVIICKFD